MGGRRPLRRIGVVSLEVRPATPDRWNDLATVFGRRGEDPSWCWCQLFLRSAPSGSATAEPVPDNREALRQEIADAAVPPGLLAYVDDHPVGWTRVGPRTDFPRVGGNRALAKLLTDEPGVWWVTCFAVDSRYRRSGVGSALLQAAVEFARDHGATAVEGHPVDVAGLSAARVGGSAVFTGTVAMFAAAGFTEVGRTYPSRPVMRVAV
jgi:GNAT superfamily N-acetyltransferase